MKRSFILLHCLFTFIAYGSEDQKIIFDPIPENCQIAVTKQNPDHSGLLALMNPYQLRVMDLECNQFFVNKNKNNSENKVPYYLSITSNDNAIAVQTVKGLTMYYPSRLHQKIKKSWPLAQANEIYLSQIGFHPIDENEIIVYNIKGTTEAITHTIEIHSVNTQQKRTSLHLTMDPEAPGNRNPAFACHPSKYKIALMPYREAMITHKLLPKKVLFISCFLLSEEKNSSFAILPAEIKNLIFMQLLSFYQSSMKKYSIPRTIWNLHSIEYCAQNNISLLSKCIRGKYDTKKKEVYTKTNDERNTYKSIIFHPINRSAALLNADVIRYYDKDIRLVLKEIMINDVVQNKIGKQLAFSPDGNQLFIAAQNKLICLDVPKEVIDYQ